MIILDIDVVSDAMKPERHWGREPGFSAQAVETLLLSSVSLAELLFGIAAVGNRARWRRKLGLRILRIIRTVTHPGARWRRES